MSTVLDPPRTLPTLREEALTPRERVCHVGASDLPVGAPGPTLCGKRLDCWYLDLERTGTCPGCGRKICPDCLAEAERLGV